MAQKKPGAGAWYLHRLEGGDAVLVADMPEDSSKVTCPKCLAPMLSIGENQIICYACGMTFSVKEGRVSRTLRKDEVERLISSPSVTLWKESLGEGSEKAASSPCANTDHRKRKLAP